jgi:hypothetical protein
VALLDPEGFVDLVAKSPLGSLLGPGAASWVPSAIAVNDFLIGAAVLAALRLPLLRAPVLAWSGIWLMIVTATKLFALG